MEIKMIKVQKGMVTKEVPERKAKDYVKNGWTVLNETPNPFDLNGYGRK